MDDDGKLVVNLVNVKVTPLLKVVCIALFLICCVEGIFLMRWASLYDDSRYEELKRCRLELIGALRINQKLIIENRRLQK